MRAPVPRTVVLRLDGVVHSGDLAAQAFARHVAAALPAEPGRAVLAGMRGFLEGTPDLLAAGIELAGPDLAAAEDGEQAVELLAAAAGLDAAGVEAARRASRVDLAASAWVLDPPDGLAEIVAATAGRAGVAVLTVPNDPAADPVLEACELTGSVDAVVRLPVSTALGQLLAAGGADAPAGGADGLPAVPMRLPAVPMRLPAVPMRLPAVPMRLPAVPLRLPAVPMRLPAVPCAWRRRWPGGAAGDRHPVVRRAGGGGRGRLCHRADRPVRAASRRADLAGARRRRAGGYRPFVDHRSVSGPGGRHDRHQGWSTPDGSPPAVPTHVLAHLSDTHLTAAGTRYNGVLDADEALHRAVAVLQEAVAGGRRLDAIVLSGDLTDTGDPDAYRRLAAAVTTIDAVPVFVPGNHDVRTVLHRELLARIESGPILQVHDVNGLRILVLDSTIPGAGHGRLCDDHLDALRAALEHPAEHGSVVVLHHAPVPPPSPLLSYFALESTSRNALAAAIEGTDVRIVLAGHHHIAQSAMLGSVPVAVAGSTAIRTDPLAGAGHDRTWASGSFNLVEVYPGTIAVSVIPVDGAGEVFDLDEQACREVIEQHPIEQHPIEQGPIGQGAD